MDELHCEFLNFPYNFLLFIVMALAIFRLPENPVQVDTAQPEQADQAQSKAASRTEGSCLAVTEQ